MLLAGGIAGLVTGVICHFVVAFALRNSLTLKENVIYTRCPRTSDSAADDDATRS